MNKSRFFATVEKSSCHLFSEATGEIPKAEFSKDVIEQRLRFRQLFFLLTFVLILLSVSGCSDSDGGKSTLVIEDAQWIAFQDGDGEWEEIEMPDDLIFTPPVTDSAGRYGLAILIANAEDQSVYTTTLQTTTNEIPSFDLRTFFDQDETSLEVTVAESSLGDDWGKVYVGGDYDTVWDSNPIIFSPETVPYDLVVTRTPNNVNYPSEMIVRTFEASAQTDVDFGTAEDVVSLDSSYTFTFNPSGYFSDDGVQTDGFEVYLQTANKTLVSMGYESNEGATFVRYSAPEDLSVVAPGGFYLLELGIDLDEESSLFYSKGFASPGFSFDEDLDLSILVPLELQHVADTSSGSMLPGMSWDETPANTVAYVSYFNGTANSIDYSTTTIVTVGRQGTENSLMMPDLSSAENWYSLWSIPSEAEASEKQANVVMSSKGVNDLSTGNLSYRSDLGGGFLDAGDWLATYSKRWLSEDIDPL
ncbi:hypothetical protein SAMN05660420_01073 [Desulfuromusa kysingii]|uniref:Uncharacterized protein n=1 Tax=Desulfuromusa kysingii TaxID=37625 RepID=A0A1H3Y382_9BACT|nr:hypothetical protein [Desulfuromusa kysingii]SEA05990.1 hypothetical protein SAMN05660420_01073 [Desulfuromusa kysingii]